MSRAAPQLNIFAVGFPITLLMGFVLMWITLPNVMTGFDEAVVEAFDLIPAILSVAIAAMAENQDGQEKSHDPTRKRLAGCAS